MINPRLIVDRHGSFSDPFEYYCGKEDAVGEQSMSKHKATESLIEEKNYNGLKRDRGMVGRNH